MEVTINLNIMWVLIGFAVGIVLYIYTTVDISTRSTQVQWLWGCGWTMILLVIVITIGKNIEASPKIWGAILSLPFVWLAAHVSGCIVMAGE